MSKKILFRVDAGGAIGLGHFYRSLSLAKSLVKNNHFITFIFQKSEFWLEVINSGFSFPTVVIDSDRGISSELDYSDINTFDILYVDGFIEYSKPTIEIIKSYGLKVMFYQNLTNSRYLCDYFIIPSINQQKSFYNGFNKNTQLFIGLKYFTFNAKVLEIKQKEPIEKINNIAITSGGSDPRNVLLTWFNLIKNHLFKGLKFTLYYGKDYQHKNCIDDNQKDNISWERFNHDNIIKNDLLISAFGVSTYEFLALKMPLMTFGHIKQNAESAEFLSNYTKTFYNLGLIDDISRRSFYKTLEYHINNIKRINNKTSKNAEFIDLRGIQRVTRIIETI